MKLWPFSNKNDMDPSEQLVAQAGQELPSSEMELPAGVVLAFPEEGPSPEPSAASQDQSMSLPLGEVSNAVEVVVPPAVSPSSSSDASESPILMSPEILPSSEPSLSKDLASFFEENSISFVSKASNTEPTTIELAFQEQASSGLEVPESKTNLSLEEHFNADFNGVAHDEQASQIYDFFLAPPEEPSSPLHEVGMLALENAIVSPVEDAPLSMMGSPVVEQTEFSELDFTLDPGRQGGQVPLTQPTDQGLFFQPIDEAAAMAPPAFHLEFQNKPMAPDLISASSSAIDVPEDLGLNQEINLIESEGFLPVGDTSTDFLPGFSVSPEPTLPDFAAPGELPPEVLEDDLRFLEQVLDSNNVLAMSNEMDELSEENAFALAEAALDQLAQAGFSSLQDDETFQVVAAEPEFEFGNSLGGALPDEAWIEEDGGDVAGYVDASDATGAPDDREMNNANPQWFHDEPAVTEALVIDLPTIQEADTAPVSMEFLEEETPPFALPPALEAPSAGTDRDFESPDPNWDVEPLSLAQCRPQSKSDNLIEASKPAASEREMSQEIAYFSQNVLLRNNQFLSRSIDSLVNAYFEKQSRE